MIEQGNLNQKNKEVPFHKQWIMGRGRAITIRWPSLSDEVSKEIP